jgi:hypothetical protein
MSNGQRRPTSALQCGHNTICRRIRQNDRASIRIAGGRPELAAILRTLAASVIVVFVVMHVYLITPGLTLASNIRVMMAGTEDIDEEEGPMASDSPHPKPGA